MIAARAVIGKTAKGGALRGALHLRFCALSLAHRDMLMHAAAIGRQFELGVLAHTLGRTSQQLRSAVRLACEHQVLEPVEGASDTFQFRHALMRDAAYDELVATQLRPLHRRIATALEELVPMGTAPIEQLAFHWWAAGDRARGLRYNERAGDRARAVHAVAQAVDHYRRALDLLARRSTARMRIERKIDEVAADA